MINNVFVLCAVCLLSSFIWGLSYNHFDRIHPVISEKGMVVTEESIATEVGLSVLEQGGNAIDAAYAIGYALAVTLPKAGNIGGGGFMMIYNHQDQQVYSLDYREKAPSSSHKDMFLDEQNNASNEKSRWSALSIGVPGTVAGLEAAHERFGTISRKKLIEPAIKLASKGVVVSNELSQSLQTHQDRLSQHQATRLTFYPNGAAYLPGEHLKQKHLASTLRLIKKHGKDGFYKGDTALKLVNYIQDEGGILTLSDLDQYEPKWRTPIKGYFYDAEIYSMPPPSSGGIAIVEALNILEPFPLENAGHNSADYIHIVSDALKFVYADRTEYLGDTDSVDVPINMLIDKDYARARSQLISTKSVLLSEDILSSNQPYSIESDETTHFVVADQYGNVVSNTYTLNFSYGNGRMAPGTGFLLNNEMDDFVSKPGVPNAYGLMGNEKNAIAPHKRMLSSMSPTIVMKDGYPFLVTGSPGGSRIITTTLQVILNTLVFDMSVSEAVTAPRFHHQWKPDILRLETGFSPDTINKLKDKGFKVKTMRTMGAAESILINDDLFYGMADTRKPQSKAKGI